MFIHANNTLLSMADARHSYECLKELDFLVYMDVFMNPTAELADVVLPAALWPEVDCVFAMPEFGTRCCSPSRSAFRWGECKSDEEFIIELCKRAGWNYGFTDQRSMLEEQMAELARRRPEYRDFTLEDLRRQGYLAPERTYYNYKRQGFHTPTGKLELLSTQMAQAGWTRCPPGRSPPETPVSNPALAEQYPLILTTGGRQQPILSPTTGRSNPCAGWSPSPGADSSGHRPKYGIAEGDWVWIENQRGRITQKAKAGAGTGPGVVNCDFGWWYPEAGAPGYGWDESNANILTCAAPPHDHYMGAYQLRGVLCKIYPNRTCAIEERYRHWMDGSSGPMRVLKIILVALGACVLALAAAASVRGGQLESV